MVGGVVVGVHHGGMVDWGDVAVWSCAMGAVAGSAGKGPIGWSNEGPGRGKSCGIEEVGNRGRMVGVNSGGGAYKDAVGCAGD